MKFIIVTIRRDTTPGLPTMRYPAIYDANEVESDKLGSIILNGEMSIMGANSSEGLLCVSDVLATKYVADSDVRIATDAEADLWLSTNKQELAKPTEEVTDAARLEGIRVKTDAGTALSTSDNDALNPKNPEPGINERKTTVAEFYPNRLTTGR